MFRFRMEEEIVEIHFAQMKICLCFLSVVVSFARFLAVENLERFLTS